MDVLIGSSPRSGSTLLGSLMASTGRMGQPGEYLHPTVHAPALSRRLLGTMTDQPIPWDSYLTALRRVRTSPNGVFVIKSHWRMYDAASREPAVARFFQNARIIWIRRDDKVAQAVSLYVARSTGVWSSRWPSQGAMPDYDAEAIADCLRTISVDDDGWATTLAPHKARVMEMTYEVLIKDTAGSLKRVSEHVGVPMDRAVDLASTDLVRAHQGVKNDWVKRFKAEPQA